MARSTRTPAIDHALLFAVLALLVIGMLAVYSASRVTAGGGTVLRQAAWAGLGLVGMAALARVDYRIWGRFRGWCFLGTIVALLLTLLLARPINGARSWVDLGAFRLQPSEFAKLLLILAFGALLTRYGARIRQFPYLLRTLAYFAIPTLLIMAQPDFGTAMVLCVMWLVMVLLTEVRWWMLAAVCLGAVLLFALAWRVGVINDFQKQRLVKRLDFIHADPAGSGYHQRQARIAIGSGQLWGKGYLQSTQATRGFLPEQETDFIFAVIGEEFGLLGCVVVLGLYFFALLRLLALAERAESPYARLITGGVAAMWAMHVIINVGMNLSLFPVAGVPLPFISYGGSSLLTNLLALGVVLNISRHRQARHTWEPMRELVRL